MIKEHLLLLLVMVSLGHLCKNACELYKSGGESPESIKSHVPENGDELDISVRCDMDVAFINTLDCNQSCLLATHNFIRFLGMSM